MFCFDLNDSIFCDTGYNNGKTHTDIDTAIAIAELLIQSGVNVNKLDIRGKLPMLEMLQKMQRCPSSLDSEELWRKQTALSELLIGEGAN